MTASASVGPCLVIVGPPGAGKSAVGQAVAARLGVAFRSTDADVEAAAGRPVAEVFVEDGETAFRDLERRVVAQALAEHSGVLSVGGGAVMDPLTEDALRGRFVVFLDVGVAEAARRTGLNRDRSVLLGNPRAEWLRLMARRRAVYERVAVAAVPVDGRAPEAVADDIVARMPSQGG